MAAHRSLLWYTSSLKLVTSRSIDHKSWSSWYCRPTAAWAEQRQGRRKEGGAAGSSVWDNYIWDRACSASSPPTMLRGLDQGVDLPPLHPVSSKIGGNWGFYSPCLSMIAARSSVSFWRHKQQLLRSSWISMYIPKATDLSYFKQSKPEKSGVTLGDSCTSMLCHLMYSFHLVGPGQRAGKPSSMHDNRKAGAVWGHWHHGSEVSPFTGHYPHVGPCGNNEITSHANYF